jgi:hypothetical protein
MGKVQIYFSDVSSAPLPRNFVRSYCSNFSRSENLFNRRANLSCKLCVGPLPISLHAGSYSGTVAFCIKSSTSRKSLHRKFAALASDCSVGNSSCVAAKSNQGVLNSLSIVLFPSRTSSAFPSDGLRLTDMSRSGKT